MFWLMEIEPMVWLWLMVLPLRKVWKTLVLRKLKRTWRTSVLMGNWHHLDLKNILGKKCWPSENLV